MFPKDLLNAPLESIRYEWDLHRERLLCGLRLVPLSGGFVHSEGIRWTGASPGCELWHLDGVDVV